MGSEQKDSAMYEVQWKCGSCDKVHSVEIVLMGPGGVVRMATLLVTLIRGDRKPRVYSLGEDGRADVTGNILGWLM